MASVVQRLLRDPHSAEYELAGGGVDAVHALAASASSIRPDEHGAIVEAMLRLPWSESESLCTAVLNFVQELVSAVPAFVARCIDALIATFVPKPVSTEVGETEALLPRVHEALRGLLRTCPLGINHLYDSIKEHLPHRRHDLRVHVGFLRQVLLLLDYCHQVRPRVIHLLVERLAALDVQVAQQLRALEEAADADDTIFEVESDIPPEELLRMRQNAEKLDTALAMLSELIRATASLPRPTGGDAAAAALTVLTAEPSAADRSAFSPPANRKRSGGSPQQSSPTTADPPAAASTSGSEANPAAEATADGAAPSAAATTADEPSLTSTSRSSSGAALASERGVEDTPPLKVRRSAMMGVSASPGSSGSLAYLAAPADPAENLFQALVSAFRASVLPTYKCRAVQFLIFYACSFDSEFARSFLQLLLAQLRSEHVHPEARIGCAGYVASFVARATFLDAEVVMQTCRELLQWASEYQAHVVSRLGGAAAQLDVHLHGTFYATVQGLLYITCYKYEMMEAITDGASGDSVLVPFGIALHAVLHGPLNPLKFCLEAIAIEFERLTICDVSDLITANERVVVASHTVGGGRNQLEDFFPFDPLHGFKQMNEIIQPLYREWKNRRAGSSEPRDSNLSALSRSADEEGLSRSLQGMSVTPCSAGCSGDHEAAIGSMGDHLHRRLHENRSLFSSMLGGSPQLHQAGFSPEYHGGRPGQPQHITPLTLP